MSNLKQIQADIASLEKKLADLKGQEKTLASEPVDRAFARELHEALCRWNHTDGCAWFYRENDWAEDPAHVRYLALSKRLLLLPGVSIDDLRDIIYLIKGAL